MITYVDASVVLRLVLGEPDPFVGWSDLQPVSSEIVRVECLRTIDRLRVVEGAEAVPSERRAAVLDTLRTFDLIGVSGAILERAGDPFPTALGTLDAIHLATALIVREEMPDLAFATHDAKLAVAARSMGFAVYGLP